ncbi:MAG: adenine phosphoribosyltransferase [Actinomycetes bacterium]
MDTAASVSDLVALVRDVPDFPRPGVVFKDISPLIGSPTAFAAAVAALVAAAPPDVDTVVGMEARGFIFAAPVALALGAGFVPVRKPGKLPGPLVTAAYDLEYGSTELAVQHDAIAPGSRVLLVDDVLATGGTVEATAGLVRRLGAEVAQVTVLLELAFLGGRRRLETAGVAPLHALWTVERA